MIVRQDYQLDRIEPGLVIGLRVYWLVQVEVHGCRADLNDNNATGNDRPHGRPLQ
jgi:hypothetical protein